MEIFTRQHSAYVCEESEWQCLTCSWCLGMGVPTVTAARILKGQLNGQSGEETQLEMERFPFVSLAKV